MMRLVRRRGARASGAGRGGSGVSAFTLLEAICALAIMAVMAGALFATLMMTARLAQATRDVARRDRATAGVSALVAKDMACVYRLSGKGARAVAVRAPEPLQRRAFLEFATTHSLGGAGQKQSALVWAAYSLEPSERARGDYALVRTETPWRWGKGMDSADARAERLADGVAACRALAYDGTAWQESYSSTQPPQLVRLELTLRTADGSEGEPAQAITGPLVAR